MSIREFLDLLKTASSVEEIDAHRLEIAEIIPLVQIMFDYDQKNSAHQYDLWFHCLHVAAGLPRGLDDDMLYLGALLHDIGKPDSRCRGKRIDDMDMHYYGHPVKSMELVRDKVIPDFAEKCARENFELTENDKSRLLFYVEHHDDHMGFTEKHIKTFQNLNISWRVFQYLMYLEVSDAIAHVQIPIIAEREATCKRLASEEGAALWQACLGYSSTSMLSI